MKSITLNINLGDYDIMEYDDLKFNINISGKMLEKVETPTYPVYLNKSEVLKEIINGDYFIDISSISSEYGEGDLTRPNIRFMIYSKEGGKPTFKCTIYSTAKNIEKLRNEMDNVSCSEFFNKHKKLTMNFL